MSNKDIVIATTNAGKLEEIRYIMQNTSYNILSLDDAGINIDIIEDGKTFEKNAMKKAITIRDICGKTVLSDDSGLVIDYLNGEPGVDTAIYLGENASYDTRFKDILYRMRLAHGSERLASFVCVIVIALTDGSHTVVRGEVKGLISELALGENGHGYDPIFFIPEHNKTFAQMDIKLKNSISHRGVALELAKEKLLKIL